MKSFLLISFLVGIIGSQSQAGVFDAKLFKKQAEATISFLRTRTIVPRAAQTINLSSATGFIKITGSGAMSVHGISAGTNGQVLRVYNDTGTNVTYINNSLFALVDFIVILVPSGNQILTMDGLDATTTGNGYAEFLYDETHWLLTAFKL